ncbi:hypothetical protein SAMN04487866_12315 [Thermoactinomyces sp. DSM 45891]|uniref:hypothetical protein n=1 Tax=Thermoactinomyces sp. DSM 45891 TaxID=1761907 RepID=UPI00090F7646|nr:hypothetical protein [Thermoactinomyces sp. DSM 45891]SFX76146.1 hypothetical protein SAMN04487866_12315 [Thermoactinomyces sp. DSM 45891]
MKATQLAFPINHIEENLVFSLDGQVYAYYQLPRMGLNTDEEMGRVQLFQQFNTDFHILIVPKMETIEEMPNFAMKPDDPAFLHKVNQIIKEKSFSSSEKQIYIGFALDRYPAENKKGKRSRWRHFHRYVESTSGIRPHDILDEEFTWYFQREQELYQQELEAFTMKRANVYHLQYLVKHAHDRGIGQSELNAMWQPTKERKIKDGQVVICPNQRDIQLLVQSEYKVQPQEMMVRRFHKDAVKEGYLRFFYLSGLVAQSVVGDYRNLFQSLPASVDLSIRGRVMPPNEAMQFLTNGRARLQEAGERGASQMLVRKSIHYMEVKPFPLFDCTFCFCLYAPTQEGLEQKSQELIDFFKDKGLEVTPSIGEQFLSFYESFPGSQGFMGDYVQRLDPIMLAESVMHASGPKPFLSLGEFASSIQIPWSPSEHGTEETTIMVTLEMELGKPGTDIELPSTLPIHEVIRLLSPMMNGNLSDNEDYILEVKSPMGDWLELDESHYFDECSIMDGAYLRIASKRQKTEYHDILSRLKGLSPERVKQLFEEWYENEVNRGGGE